MTTSQRGIDLIKEFEGFRTHAYQDMGGVWTVGYGTTRGVDPHAVVTPAEAESLMRRDLGHIEGVITSCVKVPLTQDQFDALACFAYNVGPGNLTTSTLLKKLNAGDPTGAANEFLKWNHVGQQVVAGLTARRSAERDLFLGV